MYFNRRQEQMHANDNKKGDLELLCRPQWQTPGDCLVGN